MKLNNIAIVGATGITGRNILTILEQRNFPINKIKIYASDASLKKKLSFKDSTLEVENYKNLNPEEFDFIFNCSSNQIAKEISSNILDNNLDTIMIDKSSCFREDPEVPLMIPEINLSDIEMVKNKNVVASPNCCVIPICVALNEVHKRFTIKRIIVSTYQSTSGAGKAAMDELYDQTKSVYENRQVPPNVFLKRIAFNIIPQIENFDEDGISGEESKIVNEITRLFGSDTKVFATSVRVPVFVGHSMSINFETEEYASIEDIEEALYETASLRYIAKDSEMEFATPIDTVGEDEVFASRLRVDNTCDNGFALFISCDNLRKGAGLNAVQIAESLLNQQ
jgi:aspartate-semialdehyde dehydrogenase